MQTLTPNQARFLEYQLRLYEYHLQRPNSHRTHVREMYDKALQILAKHTDPFLQATVYSIPGILPPVNN